MKRSSFAFVFAAICSIAPPATTFADEAAEEAEAREAEAFRTLEAESFGPTVLGSVGSFDPDLLASGVGVLARVQRDAGKVPALASGASVPRGAELLSVPEVRERFERTQMFGLTVHDEPSVRAYLDFFDGRGKPILARWLARMGRYQPLIQQVLEEEGLPQDLIYVAMIESGFSPRATSPKAAAGIWQFIPKTGREMGLRIDRWVDERRDPVKSTRAAAGYLKWLRGYFGSWPLALAAYNGGPGLMKNEVGRHNSNNYWRIQRNRGMYDETRRYVPKIIAAGLVSKNADVFGLDHVAPVDAESYTTVHVPGGTRLSVVAKACKVDFDDIRYLNPALVRKQTPPGEDDYPIRIPKDRLDEFVAKFDGYVRDEAGEHVRHTVAFGESLYDVGAKYEVSPRVLRVANGFERRERVSYGDEILVPKSAMGRWKAKSSSKRRVVIPNARLVIPGKKAFWYEVERGDTLDIVARGLGVNPADVVIWNDLDPTAKLQPSMTLRVFLPEAQGAEHVALLDGSEVEAVEPGSAAHKRIVRKKRNKKKQQRYKYHRVKSGESLWLIAQRNKVSVDDLKKWNKSVRRSNTLQPGQKLIVGK